MISKDSIDRIFDAARIEEVVSDFVQLKKRGVNYIGLCPFHNEKTPSFNVNPVRNIYKCFGCGKGGNAVNFVMEHEQYSYPEALRYLAKKYSIELEETAPDPEQQIIQDEKESLFALNSFAQKTFSEYLWDTEEGRAIGLSYFKERGFTEETIRKFQLGYNPTGWTVFTDHAIKSGYQHQFLEQTGLSILQDSGKRFDRFRGRVMFPIHNLSGRVIGFGGRVLKKEEKTAKYVNSPESPVYHKSQSLYGIYYARKAIVLRDNCFLVEGYTDVLALQQAGIENVVSSSGTSLTVEQIRLIQRYSKNITVLYDGDPAGIKASLRGIDLILEEGMNVKVALFPDGDDPDSFSRKHSHSEVVDFIAANAKDFVVFKTSLLLSEVQNDPVRKAMLIRDVVETIARIPDPIIRSTYLKQCSSMMEIGEQVLINELNKIRKNWLKKDLPQHDIEELLPETLLAPQQVTESTSETQEQNIIRLLLNFGLFQLHFHHEVDPESNNEKYQEYFIKVGRYIVDEIKHDGIIFENPLFQRIIDEYAGLMENDPEVDPVTFLHSDAPEIRAIAVELLSSRYLLSDNWEKMHRITVPREELVLKEAVEHSVFHLKNKKIMKMIEENQRALKEVQENGGDYTELLKKHQQLEELKMEISKMLGIDVLR